VAGGAYADQVCKDDQPLVESVRSTAPRARRVASVCTGAFFLAAAGLLNHRRDVFRAPRGGIPSIQGNSGLIFARDGHIYDLAA
jgi:putative intracellular protease/amidase